MSSEWQKPTKRLHIFVSNNNKKSVRSFAKEDIRPLQILNFMSSERYTPPAEEAHNLVLPNVEFHPSLNNPDVPYTVNFDAERCSRMLRDLGFSDNQISNTNINLTRKHPLRLVGSAKPLSSIKLYCDPIWALFDKYSADLNELADINSSSKTKKKSGKSLSKILYTKN